MQMSDKKIWILEDSASDRFVFSEILELRYQLSFFESIEAFKTTMQAHKEQPDLVIADLRLPDGNFLNFLAQANCRMLLSMPFMVVSSSEDLDVLRSCFDEGALDYIPKPFHRSELIVKIEQIFNKALHTPSEPKLCIPSVDSIVACKEEHKEVVRNLTARELQIFTALYKAKENVLTRQQLISEVWRNIKVGGKTLDVHMYNLRRKLEPMGMHVQYRSPDQYVLLSNRMDA